MTRSSLYATQAFDFLKNSTGLPAPLCPPLGGLSVGVLALAYPEVLYWGFENLDILLSPKPLDVLSPFLLLQLVGVKIAATAVCRGSGLVGGVYAPSLFIGAALGSAYGTLAHELVDWGAALFHFPAFTLGAPQAYAMVSQKLKLQSQNATPSASKPTP